MTQRIPRMVAVMNEVLAVRATRRHARIRFFMVLRSFGRCVIFARCFFLSLSVCRHKYILRLYKNQGVFPKISIREDRLPFPNGWLIVRPGMMTLTIGTISHKRCNSIRDDLRAGKQSGRIGDHPENRPVSQPPFPVFIMSHNIYYVKSDICL